MSPRRWFALVVAFVGAMVFASDFEVSVSCKQDNWWSCHGSWSCFLSFGLYGLAKKRTKADPFTSLAGEMLMLLPVLSLLEWWLFTQAEAVWFSAEPQQMAALGWAGL